MLVARMFAGHDEDVDLAPAGPVEARRDGRERAHLRAMPARICSVIWMATAKAVRPSSPLTFGLLRSRPVRACVSPPSADRSSAPPAPSCSST
jgi:hypothetical protein